jgi:hypothetical protein
MEMWKEKAAANQMIYLTRQTLCKSEAGNAVPLLTVTDSETKEVHTPTLPTVICIHFLHLFLFLSFQP